MWRGKVFDFVISSVVVGAVIVLFVLVAKLAVADGEDSRRSDAMRETIPHKVAYCNELAYGAERKARNIKRVFIEVYITPYDDVTAQARKDAWNSKTCEQVLMDNTNMLSEFKD